MSGQIVLEQIDQDVIEIDGKKFRRRDVSTQGEHVFDHRALWEALIYMNRKVMRLESMLDQGDE